MSSDPLERNDAESPATADQANGRDDENRDDVQSGPQPGQPAQPGTTDPTPKPGKEPRSDFSLAVDHHRSILGKCWTAIEKLFHYFFVGCIGLLGLAIALAIPILVLACTAVVLGIPGYLVYQLLGKKEILSPYAIVLTVFWAGYFFTHGWPRLRDGLRSMFQRMRPLLSWARTMLSSFSEKPKEEGP